MSCCGNKRSAWAQASVRPISGPVYAQNGKKMWPDIPFEYMGDSALTITGTITGNQYHFLFRGAVSVVDYRDAAAMLSIPSLVQRKSIP